MRIILNKLSAHGITDEDEQLEIIMRDYSHLLSKPTETEIEEMKQEMLIAAVEKAIAELNRESIKENGYPFAVCERKPGGVKRFKRYDALTAEEITDFRRRGVIL